MSSCQAVWATSSYVSHPCFSPRLRCNPQSTTVLLSCSPCARMGTFNVCAHVCTCMNFFLPVVPVGAETKSYSAHHYSWGGKQVLTECLMCKWWVHGWTGEQVGKASSVDQGAIFTHGHKVASWLSTGHTTTEMPDGRTKTLSEARIPSGFRKFRSPWRLGNYASTTIKPSWCYFWSGIKNFLYSKTRRWKEESLIFVSLLLMISVTLGSFTRMQREEPFSLGCSLSIEFSDNGELKPQSDISRQKYIYCQVLW